MKKHWTDNIRYEHLVAGITGGVTSTLILHPFDLVKIRFQVNDGSQVARHTYTGLFDAFKSIYRNGGIRSMYQGVTPNIAGSGSSWGLYFFAFNFLKTSLQEKLGTDNLQASYHLGVGTVAGVFTLTLTNPIWVVKTRMCLQPDSGLKTTTDYKGVIDGLVKLYKGEGIRGYYRGFVPGLFGVSHGAFQFMAYEELKKINHKYRDRSPNMKLGPLEYITIAALSKIFAVCTTYPYQVIRSRLQDVASQGKYTGTLDAISKIYRNEGARGFYKGIVPSLMRVTPACCITFLVYENIQHYLSDWIKDRT